MAALSRSDVRRRVAAAVAGISADYTESVHSYRDIGRDPSSYRHLGFAVEVLQSIPEGSRQAVSVGCLLLTDIGIRISLQLRPDERRASIDDALDVQGALVKAIMAMSAADLSSPVLLSMSSPEIADGEWAFVAVTYRIQHLIDLQ